MSAFETAEAKVLLPDEGTRIVPIPGAPIVFKAWGKRPAADYDVAEFFLPSGLGPRPHRHATHDELFYVLDGEVEFLVGDESVLLKPGSVAHIPPNTVHGFWNPTSEPSRFLLIAAPAGLHQMFEEMASLGAAGKMNPTTMRDVRLKYDTEEVDAADWAAGKSLK